MREIVTTEETNGAGYKQLKCDECGKICMVTIRDGEIDVCPCYFLHPLHNGDMSEMCNDGC